MMGGRDVSDDPGLVIIDDLDECGDHKTQLRMLSTIASLYEQSPSFPFQFLGCSDP